MAILETVLLTLGPALAKAILKVWLKDSTVASEVSESVVDLLKSKTQDVIAQQRAKRQFESIGEKVAENIFQTFKNEGTDIPSERAEKIVRLAAKTLNTASITPSLLAKKNIDPLLLKKHLLTISATESNSLSKEELTVYERILSESAQYIVDIASSLPSFSEQTLGEVLKREDQLLSAAGEILNEVRRIKQTSEDTNPEAKAARFEAEYKRAVIRQLDELELFGVDLSRTSKRQRLSVAYVNLTVERATQSNDTESDSTSSALESSIDHDLPQSSGDQSVISVGKALAETAYLLIRGDAGSGKTTLLQWVSVRSASESFEEELFNWNNSVPFFIRLRQCTDTELPSPENFPRLVAPSVSGEMPLGWVHDQLRSGRAIVLIDGVDEVPEQQREKVRLWLKELIDVFPKSRYVVTSRPHAVRQGWVASEGFLEAELQPMEIPDIDSFIDHWHNAVYESVQNEEEKNEIPKLAKTLKKSIRNTPQVRKLATSPLLCAMICALHRDRHQQLPQDRIELYESACYMLLERRDIERRVDLKDYPSLKYREKRILLQDLAYWLLKNGWSEVIIEQAKDRFTKKLQNMHGLSSTVTGQSVTRLFLERSGIVREPVKGHLDFTHRTFQEFLAATAALDEEDIGLLIKNARNDQWREVIILAVGLATPKTRERLIRGFLEEGDQNRHHSHEFYLLAAACLETAVELEAGLREEVRKRLEKILPPRTLTEAKILSMAGDLAVPLIKKVPGRRATERAACVRALCLIGTEASLDVLETLSNDKRVTVKKEFEKGWNCFEPEHQYANRVLNTWERLNIVRAHHIEGLQNLKMLKHLSLQDCYLIRDLNPVRNLNNLEFLSLTHSHDLVNLSPLGDLYNLATLFLSGGYFYIPSFTLTNDKDKRPSIDFSFLTRLSKLQNLWLSSYRGIISLDILGQLETLTKLDLSFMQPVDLLFLCKLKNLRVLSLSSIKCEIDLQLIKEIPNLEIINFAWMKIPDLSPLINFPSLKNVVCRYVEGDVRIPPELMSIVKVHDRIV